MLLLPLCMYTKDMSMLLYIYLHTDRLGFELGSNGRQGQDGTYTRLYALRRDSARP